MLSFDITDRNIRVVKGTESNGKIKISSAATLNVEENLIVNGHVKDVPNVATLINGVLKKNKMPDKEAIVSISSNLTIFKEMNVAKARPQDMQKVVKQQMQAELNLDDSYSVSYIIVGDAENVEGGEPAYRILATACPYEIVNSYREVFKLLGISLRSVMIGCNCITKVLLADTKIKSKMPLLAVQIDNNFISLNLYEQGSLSFSRFASIDAADYGYSDDYVFEAVNENIFRMLQFHRSRNTGETIENVIFYGDTHEYVRLTDELEKLDLKTSLINVPPQIHGHENLEFSLYANAIGAMFKRNKDVEKINLLETDLGAIVKSKVKGDDAGNIVLLGAVAAAILIVGGAFGFYFLKNKGLEKDIKDTDKYIKSSETKAKLDRVDRLDAMKTQVEAYETRINNTAVAYWSRPVFVGEKWKAIFEVFKNVCKEEKIQSGVLTFKTCTDGVFTLEVDVDAVEEEYAQKMPRKFVDGILAIKNKDVNALQEKLKLDDPEQNVFRTVVYKGYKVEKAKETKDNPGVKEKDSLKYEFTVELNHNKNAAVDMLQDDKDTDSENSEKSEDKD